MLVDCFKPEQGQTINRSEAIDQGDGQACHLKLVNDLSMACKCIIQKKENNKKIFSFYISCSKTTLGTL